MTKVEIKLYLEADLAGRVGDAVNQFRSGGRKVSRNEVLEKLIEDGFRMWRREAQVVNRVEAGIDRLAEQSARHDRLLRSILLTLADGDRAAYREVLDAIEKEDAAPAAPQAAE
jgi:hypothetical protein